MSTPSAPQWLDDAEHEAWLALIAVVVRLPTALDTQLQQDAQLSHFEYQVLAGLSMTPTGSIRMSDVARFAHVSLSHLSRVATRLEKRGLLTRSPDPADGRYTLATITPTGRELLEQAAPEHVATVRRHVFDRLTPTQVRQLRDICTAVLGGLDPEDLPPFAMANRAARDAGPPGE